MALRRKLEVGSFVQFIPKVGYPVLLVQIGREKVAKFPNVSET
jgi:hypothetical protein